MFPPIDPSELIRAANEIGETPDQNLAADIVHGANEATNQIRALGGETNPQHLSLADHRSATVAFVREIKRVGLMSVDTSFSAPFRNNR